MTTQYAFLFDAKFCSGCKACQAACKDKNELPPGVLWRRVMEIAGGAWETDGGAWKNSVFAYYISVSCHHCLHPKCAGICPVNAFVVREDGIVILDETKCMGCGYCSWGCPYGAPQYNPEAGIMTKCDLCLDQLEQGAPPVCVTACPLRVLNYEDMNSLPLPTADEIRLWEVTSERHPHPLPAFSHTQPRLAIKQHPAMSSSGGKFLANVEEIQPRSSSPREDVSLLLFTLLAQMAVGGVWATTWMFPTVWTLPSLNTTLFRLFPLSIVGICLGAGMLASLAHLGTKKNAWRVFANLKRSSLSREVLFTILFGLSLLITVLIVLLHTDILVGVALTAATGLGLIHHMSQVYRIPAAPGWNTWRTNVGFLVSALLLGWALMTPVLLLESIAAGTQISFQKTAVGVIGTGLLLGQLYLFNKHAIQVRVQQIRIGLILLGVLFTGLTLFQSSFSMFWSSIMLLVIVLAEESLGRWLFYRSRI